MPSIVSRYVALLAILLGAPNLVFAGEEQSSAPMKVAFELGHSGKKNQELLKRIRSEETKIQFIDTPLEEVVHYLKQLHHTEVQIDQHALAQAELKIDLPITLNVEGVDLEDGLNVLCARNKLGWYIENEMIFITSAQAEASHMTVRVYANPDGILDEEELTLAITGTIQPDSWSDSRQGGSIRAVPSGNFILVRQNRLAHEQIESLIRLLSGIED
ncbi:hypothetical protein AB1L30_19345 [Bremerella sp. JC817]|uniref:hypothetical protein n=1 Tax=Bremerella sp. JC817 TaxID=3231756 RepID=UPI0034588DDE